MEKTVSKTKLTLWVPKSVKVFGKKWSQAHNASLSRLFSDYIVRLREIEEKTDIVTPIVNKLSAVAKSKNRGKESYRKHLEQKYT